MALTGRAGIVGEMDVRKRNGRANEKADAQSRKLEIGISK